VQVANLAYCTKGRNIQQVVFDDLLANKQPQLVIVELLSEESTGGHKDFPYVSNNQQLLQTASLGNTHFIEDVFTALEARFHYFRKRTTGTLDITPPQNATVAYSYTPFKFFAEPAILEKHSEKKQKRLRRPPSSLRTLKQNQSRTYLSQMVEAAKRKGTKVVFLYLPSYGTGLPQPKDYTFYQQLGEVWLPPPHIFKEQKNWVDGEHLNYTGAKKLGNWLQQKIAATLH
jgi:hypothetical protein